jgi:molybdate transport system substrate-binding protein
MTVRRALAVLAVTWLALSGCGDAGPAGTAGPSGAVTVFAAASLTETFTRLGKDFEATGDGVTVTFNFAGSSALAQQIDQGAPADVFASASPTNLKQVADAGGVDGEATVFARNVLQIVVPRGNPAGVRGLADFGRSELTIALCAEQVPCGAAAGRALDAAGVTAAPDTLEQDVRATLAKVTLGEVDAALVYRTDVSAAGDAVEGIDFPESAQAVNEYPIAVLAGSRNKEAARAFVEYVLGPEGRRVLREAGFQID